MLSFLYGWHYYLGNCHSYCECTCYYYMLYLLTDSQFAWLSKDLSDWVRKINFTIAKEKYHFFIDIVLMHHILYSIYNLFSTWDIAEPTSCACRYCEGSNNVYKMFFVHAKQKVRNFPDWDFFAQQTNIPVYNNFLLVSYYFSSLYPNTYLSTHISHYSHL